MSDWAVEYVQKNLEMNKKEFVNLCKVPQPNPFGFECTEMSRDMEKVAPLFYVIFDALKDPNNKNPDFLELTIDWVTKILSNHKTFLSLQRILGNLKFTEK